MFKLALGIFIGLTIPLVVDLLLFGTVTPCRTIQQFEDGSTIQACSVKG